MQGPAGQVEEFGFGARGNRDAGQILSGEMIRMDASGRQQGWRGESGCFSVTYLWGTSKQKQVHQGEQAGTETSELLLR